MGGHGRQWARSLWPQACQRLNPLLLLSHVQSRHKQTRNQVQDAEQEKGYCSIKVLYSRRSSSLESLCSPTHSVISMDRQKP